MWVISHYLAITLSSLTPMEITSVSQSQRRPFKMSNLVKINRLSQQEGNNQTSCSRHETNLSCDLLFF